MISFVALTLTLSRREAPTANQSAFSPQHVTSEISETSAFRRIPASLRNASSTKPATINFPILSNYQPTQYNL